MIYFMIIGTAFLMGIGAVAIISGMLHHLIQETEEMENTGNSFLKQMKLRYKNCMRIGHEINNTEAFAGKYMERYKSHGIGVNTYDKIASVCSGICVIGGLTGALMNREHIMEFLMLGFLAMYVINGMKRMVDIHSKKRRITRNIVDFFENRYYAATDEMKENGRNSDDIMEKTMEKLDKREYTEEERRIIDDILREYLG